jgi:transposase
MENVTLVGIDLAKSVFEICGVNHQGKVVVRKKLRREQLLGFVGSLPKGCEVVMEACGSSGFWGRMFQRLDYRVKLVAPQHVKPFRKSQKNDRNDAEAIAESAQRPTMRFVAVKQQEQIEFQTLVGVREQCVRERTSLVNQIHGILSEQGFAAPRGMTRLVAFVENLLSEPQTFSELLGELLRERLSMLRHLSRTLEGYTTKVRQIAKAHPLCRLAMSVPGVGIIGAVAFVARTPQAGEFRNGRNFAAWLGIVPQQYSSGGKTTLGKITKRGDCLLRKTLIHGARSVLHHAARRNDSLSLWAKALQARKGTNLASVALANKLARVLYCVLAQQKPYLPPMPKIA